jgi:hypothetical protein
VSGLIVPKWVISEARRMLVRQAEAHARLHQRLFREPRVGALGSIERQYSEARDFVDALNIVEAIAGSSHPELNRQAARLAVKA